MGFRPPLRHQRGESTLASIPSSLRSALRVSHPLDGFLLASPCGFISPRSHIRGSPFRGFPSAAAAPPYGGRCPLAVLPRHLPHFREAPAARPQLQGFALRRSPLPPPEVLPSCGARSPPGFYFLQVFDPLRGPAFTGPPLMALFDRPFTLVRPNDLQRFDRLRSRRCSLEPHRPARSF